MTLPTTPALRELKPGDWVRVSWTCYVVESEPFDLHGALHVKTSGGTFNVRGIDEVRPNPSPAQPQGGLIGEDGRKLLERLTGPCDGDDNHEDHSWRNCRRCAALHLLESRDKLTVTLLDALLASLDPPQGRTPTWQPIVTVPKDGRDVLVLHPDDSICISYWGCIRGVYGLKSKLHSSAGGGEGDFCRDAAHWMPLPPSPLSGRTDELQEPQKVSEASR